MSNDCKPSRNSQGVCRTINLAQRLDCLKPEPYAPCRDSPVIKTWGPVCTKVISREEAINLKSKKSPQPVCPPHSPTRLAYAIRTGVLLGTVYVTYNQGIWGDQKDVMDALARWRRFMLSFSTRPNPNDLCPVENPNIKVFAPLYHLYKDLVTCCFTCISTTPTRLKCALIKYKKDLDNFKASRDAPQKK